VGPKARLEERGKEKISCRHRGANTEPSSKKRVVTPSKAGSFVLFSQCYLLSTNAVHVKFACYKIRISHRPASRKMSTGHLYGRIYFNGLKTVRMSHISHPYSNFENFRNSSFPPSASLTTLNMSTVK
jgi:hypothetical protein